MPRPQVKTTVLTADELARAKRLLDIYDDYVEQHDQEWDDCQLVAFDATDEIYYKFLHLDPGETMLASLEHGQRVVCKHEDTIVVFPYELLVDQQLYEHELAKAQA